jgi:hypothetical protein
MKEEEDCQLSHSSLLSRTRIYMDYYFIFFLSFVTPRKHVFRLIKSLVSRVINPYFHMDLFFRVNISVFLGFFFLPIFLQYFADFVMQLLPPKQACSSSSGRSPPPPSPFPRRWLHLMLRRLSFPSSVGSVSLVLLLLLAGCCCWLADDVSAAASEQRLWLARHGKDQAWNDPLWARVFII